MESKAVFVRGKFQHQREVLMIFRRMKQLVPRILTCEDVKDFFL